MLPPIFDQPRDQAYLEFIRAGAAALREADEPPASPAEWEQRKAELRRRLIDAWGGFPEEPCELDPQLLGVVERDGYRIERLLLQTRPGIWMTANAYVPADGPTKVASAAPRLAKPAAAPPLAKGGLGGVADFAADHRGRVSLRPCHPIPAPGGTAGLSSSAPPGGPASACRPAVLCVHGHWSWARVDPHVQARCLGLVKLGYFVLAVDAFGAGERAIQPAAGTYHGALVGSMLWPVGQPLSGFQVYDNIRAVDYLQSRPEVDPERLAVTGASGGGNQTMYVGAMDERLKAVVPVCSVGTYEAYLGVACCVCEVVPAALTFCREGDVLAMVAPRALLVINATMDGIQFSVGEAEKSIAWARRTFRLYDADAKLRHATFESPHDYNQPMREAMYGWCARWLKDEGDGSPIPEPEIEIEEVETIRCFPEDGEVERPANFHTIPSYAFEQARKLVSRIPVPDHREQWEADAMMRRARLRELLGGFPERTPLEAETIDARREGDLEIEAVVIHPEPGMPVPMYVVSPGGVDGSRAAILLDFAGKSSWDLQGEPARRLLDNGVRLVLPDLRATGETAVPSDAIRDARDHNSTEWGLWVGRPLLGQWVWDVIRIVDYLEHRQGARLEQLTLVGRSSAGIVALCAAALDERIDEVTTIDMPSTYVSDEPYGPEMAMGVLVPHILRVGDVQHLAALVAPRPVNIEASGHASAAVHRAPFTQAVYGLLPADDMLRL